MNQKAKNVGTVNQILYQLQTKSRNAYEEANIAGVVKHAEGWWQDWGDIQDTHRCSKKQRDLSRQYM